MAKNVNLSFLICSRYMIWVFIDYYIDNFEIKSRSRHILYVLGVAAFCILFLELGIILMN